MTTGSIRGIRNNNPGNIEKNPNNEWLGISTVPVNGESELDPRFETFKTPVYGIRALARTLITYRAKHNLNSVDAIISRWAPAEENNVNAYVQSVMNRSGLPQYAPLDLFDYDTIYSLVTAIIYHENGKQPYTKGTIDKALTMAGITVPNATTIIRCNDEQVKRDRLNKTAIGCVGGSGLATIAENSGYVSMISGNLQSLLGFGVLTLLIVALGVLLYNYHGEIREFIKSKFDL